MATPKYNTYVGMRYVPIFDGEWDRTKTYEPLTIVSYQGNSYTSRTFIPVGMDINNTAYWALTGNYNAQVEYYRQETARVGEEVDDCTHAYNNVSAMKADTNLEDGMVCKTLGYYNINDGGGAYYYITDTEPSNYHETLNNNLYGELIIKSFATPEMYGAYGDGVHDDTTAIQNACLSGKNVYLDKTYLVTEQIEVGNPIIIYGGVVSCLTELNDSIFLITSVDVTFSHVEIIGSKDQATAGIRAQSSHSYDVFNCVIHDFGLYGVNGAKRVLYSHFYNCACLTGRDTGQGAIYSGQDNVEFAYNLIECKYGDGLDHGIYCGGEDHKNIKIVGNKIISLSECTCGPLIACYSSNSSTTHKNVLIDGNELDYSNHDTSSSDSRACIVCTIENSQIINNKIIGGNEARGDVSLWIHKCNNVLISGNTFSNARGKIDDSTKCTILNNLFNSGLDIDDTTQAIKLNVIKGNHFEGISAIVTLRCKDTKTVYGYEIINNIFNNANIAFVSTAVAAVTDTVISDNTFYNVNNYAVYIGTGSRVRFLRNSVFCDNNSLTGSQGIRLYFNDAESVVCFNLVRGVNNTPFSASNNCVHFYNMYTDELFTKVQTDWVRIVS